MRKMTIDKVQDGMVLAKPLHNIEGKVLLAQGCKLSTRIISRLDEWGCDIVYVEGEPETLSEQKSVLGYSCKDGDVEKLLEEIELRFSNVSDDPVLQMVKTTLKEHLIRKYGDHGNETAETGESGS
ncbi:MAG: hypothetical protein RBU23_00040 [Candidatus Auribacterota bacterium]|jgi:hypothetical protein|nr:hypothetical protein [Candidatus Auribacterota bacterium]